MQRCQCPIYNRTLEALIWSKMWKKSSFFWLKKCLFISLSLPFAQETSQRNRKWKWTIKQINSDIYFILYQKKVSMVTDNYTYSPFKPFYTRFSHPLINHLITICFRSKYFKFLVWKLLIWWGLSLNLLLLLKNGIWFILVTIIFVSL